MNLKETPIGLRRDRAYRVKLGVVAMPLFLLSGMGMWHTFGKPWFHDSPTVLVVLGICGRGILLGIFILATLSIIWAILAPRWLVTALEKWAVIMSIAIVVFLLFVFQLFLRK